MFAAAARAACVLRPKRCGNDQGVDPLVLPPGALVAPPVQLTMVQPADGNGETVTDFPPHRPLLCKFDVVGIRRGPTADEAGLRGHKLQVFAVALTYRLTDDGDCLLARIDLQRLIARAVRLLMSGCARLRFSELAQPRREGVFDRLGIRR